MPEKSVVFLETRWQQLVELRSRREIVQRWLQTDGVPEVLLEQLKLQLEEIEQQLRLAEALSRPRRAVGIAALRKAV